MTNFIHMLNMRCMNKIDRRGGGPKSFTRKILKSLFFYLWNSSVWIGELEILGCIVVQNIIITLLRIRIYRGPRLCWIHNRIIRCDGVGHVHRRRRCGGKRRHFVWDKKKFGRNLSTFQVLQSRHFFTMITIFCNKVYLIFSHNESYQIFITWYS